VARFIVSQLPEGQYLLTLGRTNWKFGQTHINILCLAIVQQGVVIPVLSILSDKTGNSNTDERIPLINRFIELFGVEKLMATSPIENSSVRNCTEFVRYLIKNEIKFRIRIQHTHASLGAGMARHRPAISFVTCHAAESSN